MPILKWIGEKALIVNCVDRRRERTKEVLGRISIYWNRAKYVTVWGGEAPELPWDDKRVPDTTSHHLRRAGKEAPGIIWFSFSKNCRSRSLPSAEVNLPSVSDREQMSTPQDRNLETAESLEGAYIAKRLRANAPVCRLSAVCIELRYI